MAPKRACSLPMNPQTIRDTTIASNFLEECTPGYYNNEGGGDGGIRSALGEPYQPGFYAFEKLLQEWRDEGDLKGLVLSTKGDRE